MKLITVTNLQKLFPIRRGVFSRKVDYVHAVDDVSFSIERGGIFGIVGESGCGKTTTSKLLIRLLEPTGGSIVFDGNDISHLKGIKLKHFRKNVQMIFQDPYESLNPRFTIFDAVAEPLIIQEVGDIMEREDLVSRALEVVDLKPAEDFVFRYPHELSGGQRQRVAIARALVIEPKFIVADEPVSMLDVSIRAGVMNLMLDLRERFNLTYVFVTHDLAVARYMCDHITVMYLGKIAEMGKTEDIIKNPKHPYTQALLSAVPIPDPHEKRRRIEIAGRVSTPINPPPGCRFAPRCPYVMDICRRQTPELKEIEKEHLASCWLY